jgi:hypothetical protein
MYFHIHPSRASDCQHRPPIALLLWHLSSAIDVLQATEDEAAAGGLTRFANWLRRCRSLLARLAITCARRAAEDAT